MCSPLVGIGAQSLGAGMAALGSMYAASAQRSALRSQARIADINATIVDEAARGTVRAGTIQESRVRMAGEQAKSRAIAQTAGRGIALDSASVQARLTGTDLVTEVDAATVRANAMREALGQRFEADNLRADARSARAAAAGISPGMALATSLIGSAGQIAKSVSAINKQTANTDAGSSLQSTSNTVNASLNNFTPESKDVDWSNVFGTPVKQGRVFIDEYPIEGSRYGG